ncbi:tetratricopeptide repeat protein [Desulfocurvibacter africanus]|uniref:Tetratricopeptide repeat protein n=1 Tax=Desulfocurvibacter africanus subsp. africanus str. Walvis Bay TaxID=690850 RepID=F3YXB4_DESAF|nr:tetratricopeptide repeat protein [Desulfocurvibacter africanus]EGJ50612.1 hypothetical protein Desaf_2286 [Desulfocurvibacter africanus subsp. africanus str. Walvis Bay]
MKETHDAKGLSGAKVSRRGLLLGLVNRFRGPEEAGGQVTGIAPESLQADALAGSGEYAQAAAAYRCILEQSPEAHDIRAKLGWCLYKAGRIVQAKVELQRVLRKAESRLASLYLGLCLTREGKLEAALKAWQNYFNPDEPEIMREINLIRARLESGQTLEPQAAADQVEAAADRSKA